MSHNVVILQPETSIPEFGEAAAQAKESGYVPQDKLTQVIAHTKMLGPGESDEITFNLSEPGVYDFICSFPGHWGSMKGQIVATP